MKTILFIFFMWFQSKLFINIPTFTLPDVIILMAVLGTFVVSDLYNLFMGKHNG